MDPMDRPDPDAEARREALGEMGRRVAIWAVPLFILGLLLTALGIPVWISFSAMGLVLIFLVFEIDL